MAPKKELSAPPSTPDVEEDDVDMDLGEEGEEDEEGEYEEEMGFDIAASLEPFLATEDGQTVATALVTIGKHLEMQNKILVKILSKIAKE